MQKRMLEAVEAIPGVESVGLVNPAPLYAGSVSSLVFTDKTADLSPANAVADVFLYKVSPEYFHAAGTPLLSGRTFTWHDDEDAPRVAVVNAEFARKIFGSVSGAVGGYYKIEDGTRIQVVGIAEQGKYHSINEDAKPAMFLPFLQSPSSETWIVVRSWPLTFKRIGFRRIAFKRVRFRQRRAATGACNQKHTARPGCRPARLHPDMDQGTGPCSFRLAYGHAISGSSGHNRRDTLCDWHLWNGCILCKQAAERARNSYGSRRAAQGSFASSIGTRPKIGCHRFHGRWVHAKKVMGHAALRSDLRSQKS